MTPGHMIFCFITSSTPTTFLRTAFGISRHGIIFARMAAKVSFIPAVLFMWVSPAAPKQPAVLAWGSIVPSTSSMVALKSSSGTGRPVQGVEMAPGVICSNTTARATSANASGDGLKYEKERCR
ncbi:hypothetical protein [Candidatus Skiveiella danica]|uniref:hypothetical protein n=1 Tax=Candidatus Skiveiella danica TaxID=3386177 RepID=UPI0039B876B7